MLESHISGLGFLKHLVLSYRRDAHPLRLLVALHPGDHVVLHCRADGRADHELRPVAHQQSAGAALLGRPLGGCSRGADGAAPTGTAFTPFM